MTSSNVLFCSEFKDIQLTEYIEVLRNQKILHLRIWNLIILNFFIFQKMKK